MIGQSILDAAILLAELEQPLVAQFTEGCLKNVNLHFSLALTRSAQRTRLLGVKCGSNSLLVRFLGAITKAARDVSSVAIKDLTDKRNITFTFVVTLSGESSYPCKSYTKGKQQPTNKEVLSPQRIRNFSESIEDETLNLER